MILLHICHRSAWEQAVKSGNYEAPSLREEGFIHFSLPHQALGVASRHFKTDDDLVLLLVDDKQISTPIKFENLDGGAELYPHLYGVLPCRAVSQVFDFRAGEQGDYKLPEELQGIGTEISGAAMDLPLCPCGSEISYRYCCEPHLAGKIAARDPETLLRSRYTAFCQSDLDYLRATWHPDTLPELDGSEPSQWVGLEILEVAVDEEELEAEIEFVAKLIIDNSLETLHEVSDFEKVDGRWLYYSGEFKSESSSLKKIPLGSPCPCQSGKTFKNCHYQK